MPPRPNILYLHSHDTGRWVQPYGAPVPTPNVQRLAEEGVLFRQAFCVAPTCSPSRSALVTGQCPHNNGMLGLAHRGFALYDYRQHLVHTLRAAGYRSTLIGVQHVAPQSGMIGYDQVVPVASSAAEHVAPAATAWLADAPAQPFFLSVGLFETHREFPAPGPDEDVRYTNPPALLPDTPGTRADMAAYIASARRLDAAIGQVLQALDEAGLAEDTLVICTTDHGIAFPRFKCNLTDSGTGVMLILRGPGGFEGGQVCDAMVSHMDVFPTLCELLEIEPPPWLQGASLLPLLRGECEQLHDELFAEVTYHAAYEPMRSVRTQRWQYIRRFGERAEKPILPNCDDSLSKDAWLAAGWRQRPVATEQLYDLALDPQEVRNLAGEATYAGVLADLRARLERWMRATADPLLHGPVPAPHGAQVNDPDGLSPQEPTQTCP